MAYKHLFDYYNQICEQYQEMVENLKDFEQAAMEGLVEPERIDQIKESIQPLMRNYERISYIMYLVNKPTRKAKGKKYDKQHSKLLKNIEKNNSLQAVKQENEHSINNLKNILK